MVLVAVVLDLALPVLEQEEQSLRAVTSYRPGMFLAEKLAVVEGLRLPHVLEAGGTVVA
jgi:hypothetical protein